MLFVRRDDDHVAGADLFDRSAPPLDASAAGRYDQPLSERVRVPRGARARLERDEPGADARRLLRREERIDAHRAGEVLVGTFCGRLRAGVLNVHAFPFPSQSSRGDVPSR